MHQSPALCSGLFVTLDSEDATVMMKNSNSIRQSIRFLVVQVLVLFTFIGLTMPAYAQSGGGIGGGFSPTSTTVLNEYMTQPDVWRPATPITPGVDAKGDLNLSLPIMTVPGRNGLNYDIQFGYRSGITVKQQASWLGLGWFFDPGSITRDVQGVVLSNGVTSTAYNVDYTEIHPVQQDMYYVTAPGVSFSMARFVPNSNVNTIQPPRVEEEGGFYATDWRPWKIVGQSTGPVQVAGQPATLITKSCTYETACMDKDDYHRFVLTSPDGTRYIFEKPTISTFDGYSLNTPKNAHEYYVNTWRLTAILGRDYQGDDPPADRTGEGSWIKLVYGQVYTARGDVIDTVLGYRKEMQTTYLQEIITPTHRAVFNLAHRDPDVYPNPFTSSPAVYRKLTGIELYAHYGQPDPLQDVLVREVKLNHDEDGLTGDIVSRMSLDEILFYGNDPAADPLPGYAFEYYNTGSGITVDDDYTDDFGYFNLEGTSFDDDAQDARYWSLKSILHPTGGKDVIFYENDVVTMFLQPDGSFQPYMVAYVEQDDDLGSVADHYYSFEAGKTRQGGCRVTQIEHYQDQGVQPMGTTTYSYGPGRASGVPPYHWHRSLSSGTLFKPAGRGRAAVYYDMVTATQEDGTLETTFYTTPYTAAGPVNTLKAILYIHGARTVVQDNGDINWGIPYKTVNNIAEVERIHDLSAIPLANAFISSQATPTHVNILWQYAGIVREEERLEYRSGADGSGDEHVRTHTEYEYDEIGPSATGFLRETRVSGSGLAYPRVTKRKYAFEIQGAPYDNLIAANILTPVFQESVAEDRDGTLYYHTSQATTWGSYPQDGYAVLHPSAMYQWNASQPSSAEPVFSPGGTNPAWDLGVAYTNYDAFGNVLQQEDAEGTPLFFYYGDNNNPYTQISGFNHALLTGVEIGTAPNALQVHMEYDPRGQLTRTYDPNNRKRSFGYDPHGRLESVKNDNGEEVASQVYFTSRECPTTGWCANELYDSSNPNFVRTIQHISGATYETTEYFDAYGRSIQTQAKDGNGAIISAVDYDALGRVLKEWKPYRYTTTPTHSFDANYNDNAKAYYDGNPGPNAHDYPFVEHQYDGSGRLMRTYPPALDASREDHLKFGFHGAYLRTPEGVKLADFLKVDVTTNEMDQHTLVYKDGLDQAKVSRRYVEVAPWSDIPADITLTAQKGICGPGGSGSEGGSEPSIPEVTWEEEEGTFTVPKTQLVFYDITLQQEGYGFAEVNIKEDDDFLRKIFYDNSLSENEYQGVFVAYPNAEYTVTARAASPDDPEFEGCASTSAQIIFTQNGKVTSLVDTRFEYDGVGNLIKVMPPNYFTASSNPEVWETRYTYNTLGQLTRKDTPDAEGGSSGDFRYAYDTRGNLRFTEDPNHLVRPGSGFLYTKYDLFNRPIEEGVYTGSTSFNTARDTEADDEDWPLQNRAEVVHYVYDNYNLTCTHYADQGITPCPTVPSGLNIDNPKGNLTQVIAEGSYYWYFYDAEGRIEALYQQVHETVGPTLLAYEYDRVGKVTKISYQAEEADEDLYYWFDYNNLGQLATVKTNEEDNEATAVLEASYNDYAATGQVKALALGADPAKIPTVDYVYNARDWLEYINHPGPANEPFATWLDYTANGNVKVQYWVTPANMDLTLRAKYIYHYDAMNRLTHADFLRFENSWVPDSLYDVGYDANGVAPITYDANGNITLLNRMIRGEDETPLNTALEYHYDNSNRLEEILMSVDMAPPETIDFDYDANGNMTKSRTADVIDYDRRNLPINMDMGDGTSLKFTYDADGQRTYKRLYDNTSQDTIEETFYVRGADGSVLAVYVNDHNGLRLNYWNILAGGRVIGRIEPPGN